jgi:hypothetical protein
VAEQDQVLQVRKTLWKAASPRGSPRCYIFHSAVEISMDLMLRAPSIMLPCIKVGAAYGGLLAVHPWAVIWFRVVVTLVSLPLQHKVLLQSGHDICLPGDAGRVLSSRPLHLRTHLLAHFLGVLSGGRCWIFIKCLSCGCCDNYTCSHLIC